MDKGQETKATSELLEQLNPPIAEQLESKVWEPRVYFSVHRIPESGEGCFRKSSLFRPSVGILQA